MRKESTDPCASPKYEFDQMLMWLRRCGSVFLQTVHEIAWWMVLCGCVDLERVASLRVGRYYQTIGYLVHAFKFDVFIEYKDR